MTYDEALSYIHSLSKFGSKPGLTRVSRLVSLASNPHKDLKFIHIAGTSGKGSTASFCASILKSAGLKVGLYTSPYIIDFRERFQINGSPIAKNDFCRLCEMLIPFVEKLNREGDIITEFEFNTVLGFLWFKEQKCDIVCLEVGMGGRFDATNLIDAPLVSVITRIGLDHTAFLGNTVSEIAFEKCGIIKKGSKVVCYPNQRSEALSVIEKTAKEQGCALSIPSLSDISDTELSLGGSTFTFEGKRYSLKMSGEHQIHNAVTAIYAIGCLSEYGINIPTSAIKTGLSDVTCPARLEVISQNPTVIIDGAHNADKVSALYEHIKSYKGKIVAICGMLADKDYEGAVSKIAPLCKSIVAVTPQNPRALLAEDMAKTSRVFCSDTSAAGSISEASRLALSKLEGDDILLCWGSLYIAGEVKRELEQILDGNN